MLPRARVHNACVAQLCVCVWACVCVREGPVRDFEIAAPSRANFNPKATSAEEKSSGLWGPTLQLYSVRRTFSAKAALACEARPCGCTLCDWVAAPATRKLPKSQLKGATHAGLIQTGMSGTFNLGGVTHALARPPVHSVAGWRRQSATPFGDAPGLQC